MHAPWRDVVGQRLGPALWVLGAVAAFVITLLARKAGDLQSPVVAATAVILLWYTAETHGLRLEQERLRKQQDADNELRNHPWLRATDLKPDWKASEETGLFGRWTVYLPITNVGTSPAFDVTTRVEWKLTSADIPQSGEGTFRKLVLAPQDTAHTHLCEVDLHGPDDRVSIGVEVVYRNHLGGGGRLHLTFLQDEPGKGWANGPMSYEFWLSDGRRYPAPPVAPGATHQASAAQEVVAAPTSPRWPPDWLRSAIQVSALVLTLEAAFFLAKGNLGLAPEVIAQLAATKVGYNLDVARSLSMQAADTWVGFVLLLGAFVLQVANGLWPMRWRDFTVSRPGVVVGLGVSALAFGAAAWASCFLTQRTEARVIQILSALQ